MSMRQLTRLTDYWTLTKPDVNLLIGITTAVGFWLGRTSPAHDVSDASYVQLLHTVAGTLLIAGGTGTLNQWMEWRFDALMRRTARRPIAVGQIDPSHALVFGFLLSVSGAVYLAAVVNVLSSAIALATLASYLFVYTPLKRKTPLCVIVGAIPGAAPPLIGWAGATGSLSLDAWMLYAIVFLWQFPHFMAIAWMYRHDYDRAGYLVVPAGEQGTVFMICQMGVACILLLPLSLAPVVLGRAGLTYLAAAVALGAWFAYRIDRLAVERSNAMARRLLFASIGYLPLLFATLIVDGV
jgi:protoheme IX farnesyltransferase